MSSAGADEQHISPADYLSRLGNAGDGPHDIATAALMLAALDHPATKLAPFEVHLRELSDASRAEATFARDAEGGAVAVGQILAGRYGYDGERAAYDDPGSADLITVIERRRGLPVAIGILYMHVARAAGMEAQGLAAPGHFLLRIGLKGSEALIDPFNGGAALDRERLSSPMGVPIILAEPAQGDEPSPFEPVSDTDVLLRLQNNIRSRALKNRDTARAIEIGRRMTQIAPHRASLWLELARLQEAAGGLSGARKSYERCLQASRSGDLFHNDATLALSALTRRIN